MNDQNYILILRLLHITCGVFWAGSAIYMALFLLPAVKASGPDGAKFMQQLGKTGFPIVIMLAAMINVLTGLLLIWKLSNGLQPVWFSIMYSKVLSLGSGVAIIAFLIGFTVNRPAGMRMDKIGQAIAQSGGVPTSEQMHEITALRKKLFTGTNYIAVLLTIAVIAMAICRYVS